MIRIEKTEVTGWKAAIRGMRNPMNSWDKMDSRYCHEIPDCKGCWSKDQICSDMLMSYDPFSMGKHDYELARKLTTGGSVHAKYRRMIVVYADITAPLYWWKEMDTYKVGTVANSCSTMHKIHAKKFELDDFSYEHLFDYESCANNEWEVLVMVERPNVYISGLQMLKLTINALNFHRKQFLETKNKDYWWQMIQLLPSSYNQRRTMMLNYENLSAIYHDRKNHKLDEWHNFCDWIKALPYSDLITGEEGDHAIGDS